MGTVKQKPVSTVNNVSRETSKKKPILEVRRRALSTGIDFAMTALFTVIFVEQWLAAKQHGAVYIAIAAILISTALFQLSNFLLPALILLVILLVIFQDKVEKKEDAS